MAQVTVFACDICGEKASITCKWKLIDKNSEGAADFCNKCWPSKDLPKSKPQPDIATDSLLILPSSKEVASLNKWSKKQVIGADELPEKKRIEPVTKSPSTTSELIADAEAIDINDFKFDKAKALAKIEKAAKKVNRLPDINEKIIARAAAGGSSDNCSTNHANVTVTDRSKNYGICNDCGANLVGGRTI